MKFYVAYGSNLNKQQMAFRCPDAKIVGTGVIRNYQLQFCRVATIVPCSGSEVPVTVWKVSQKDEKNLDVYEGFPTYYRKEKLRVVFNNGTTANAMVYLLNHGMQVRPSSQYFHIILQGYRDFSFDESYLQEAFDRSQKVSSHDVRSID